MNKGENIDDGKGKQTFNTASVQLADAAFAANGATHLELGQNGDPQVKPGNYTKCWKGLTSLTATVTCRKTLSTGCPATTT